MNTSASIGVWTKSTGRIVSNFENDLGEPEELGKILMGLFSRPKDALRASILGILCDKEPDNAIVFDNIDSYLETSCADYMYLYDGERWFFATKKAKTFEELEHFLLTSH
jgi:hypothetical protein